MIVLHRRLVKVWTKEILLVIFASNSFLSGENTMACSNRYENRENIFYALPELKNCNIVKKQFPICGRTISVLYTPQPPYVLSPQNNSGDPVGILPDLLNVVLEVCCFGCMNVTYHGPVNYLQKFLPSNDTLFMPLQSSFQSRFFAGYDYIPFLENHRVSFLAKEASEQWKAHENTVHLMTSVISTWPLFVIAILMALTSGCVMWALDTWFNEEDFPHKFPRGAFEGFWWAFVAMTTVGFGDRVPKSVVGKGFAVLWIFIGITVFSMYTAVLTSALAISTRVFKHETFVNKTIGVLSFTAAGETKALEEHANLKRFKNIQQMAQALKDDEIDAMALDDIIARYRMEMVRKIVPSARSHHVVGRSQNSYGVLSHDKDITTFLRTFFETNEDQRKAMLMQVLYDRWPDMRKEEDPVVKASFFDSNSPVYKAAVIGLTVVGIVACMIGSMCRILFHKNNGVFVKYVNCMEGNIDCHTLVNPNKDDVEMSRHIIETCIDELEDFSSRWKAKLYMLDSERRGKCDMVSGPIVNEAKVTQSYETMEMHQIVGDVAIETKKQTKRRNEGPRQRTNTGPTKGDGGDTGEGKGSRIRNHALEQICQYLGKSSS